MRLVYYPAAADLSVVDLRGFGNLEGLTLLLNYRAATGYLTALMTIYLGAEVPPASVIELAEVDASLPVKTR